MNLMFQMMPTLKLFFVGRYISWGFAEVSLLIILSLHGKSKIPIMMQIVHV